MHQPPYNLKSRNLLVLPWVRLHALKDYYDMAAYVDETPGFKCTINMVPSLVEQILLYEKEETKDYFFVLSEKPAHELTLDERAFILLNFFAINVERNIKPYPFYYQLYKKRGKIADMEEARLAAYSFTDEEFLDLQVWFNLVWFGRSLKGNPKIRALIEKGCSFTEEEKNFVLSVERDHIRKIIPLLKRLQESGNIEITTSPYNHPILPLLCDTRIAQTSDPTTSLPQKNFHYPEDAVEQVSRAIEYHKRVFGREPKGVWPPEASVSESTLAILADASLKWFATDEDIFRKSIELSMGGASESFLSRIENFYRPYRFHRKGKEIIGFFRDKRLSNKISFDYWALKGEEAVQDLINSLKNIRQRLPDDGSDYIVPIVMDGENAWEYFEENGEPFLKALHLALSDDPKLKPITFSEFLETKNPRLEHLARVFPGSWIKTNFKTWIGQAEKNKAWEMLEKVRSDIERYRGMENWESAYERVLRAEASDWFWWYGSENPTAFASEFDYLFRNHLKDAYIELGLEPIRELEETILSAYLVVPPTRQPTNLFSPTLDGKEAGFYEWSPAGYYEQSKLKRRNLGFESEFVDKVYFGFNLSSLFLRIELCAKRVTEFLTPTRKITIEFVRPENVRLTFSANENGKIECEFFKKAGDRWEGVQNLCRYAALDVIELELPFESLNAKSGDSVLFFVLVNENSKLIERFPSIGFMELIVPNPTFAEDFWYV